MPSKSHEIVLAHDQEPSYEPEFNLFLIPSFSSRAACKKGLAYLLRSVISEAHMEVSPDFMRIFKGKSHEA